MDTPTVIAWLTGIMSFILPVKLHYSSTLVFRPNCRNFLTFLGIRVILMFSFFPFPTFVWHVIVPVIIGWGLSNTVSIRTVFKGSRNFMQSITDVFFFFLASRFRVWYKDHSDSGIGQRIVDSFLLDTAVRSCSSVGGTLAPRTVGAGIFCDNKCSKESNVCSCNFSKNA